jgi:hypothetical protein
LRGSKNALQPHVAVSGMDFLPGIDESGLVLCGTSLQLAEWCAAAAAAALLARSGCDAIATPLFDLPDPAVAIAETEARSESDSPFSRLSSEESICLPEPLFPCEAPDEFEAAVAPAGAGPGPIKMSSTPRSLRRARSPKATVYARPLPSRTKEPRSVSPPCNCPPAIDITSGAPAAAALPATVQMEQLNAKAKALTEVIAHLEIELQCLTDVVCRVHRPRHTS